MNDLRLIVIPAKAGVSAAHMDAEGEIPVFAGMTEVGA